MTGDREAMRALALRDFLNCCAMAVDEDESGHRAAAEVAHREARIAAADLFVRGDYPLGGAIRILLGACRPGRRDRERGTLWNALAAASLAALALTGGQRELAPEVTLPGAKAAAKALPVPWREALETILSEAEAMAPGVPA